MTNNLTFLERFDGTLGSWTLDTSGGTVSIALKDFSNKLKLYNTNSAFLVSATRSFTEPSGKWILEYDIYYTSGSIGVAELLDVSNNVIATVDCGSTADTVSFNTDTAGVSTAPFTAGTYKQCILVLDNITNTIKAYVSEDDVVLGSLRQIGTVKSYSGTAISKVRFRAGVVAGSGSTGIVYIDEVKVYTPDIFIVGDSITDGKLYWSTHPGYTYPGPPISGRLTTYVDKNSSPGYQLSQKLGSSVWVANRAFGGSRFADIDTKIQAALLDHNPTRVYIAAGRNDIGGTSLSSMLTSLNSIISKVQTAGITGKNILLGNIISAGPYAALTEWNIWVKNKAKEIGAIFVDLDAGMTDPLNPDYGNPAYTDTLLINDGVHFNPTGSGEIARLIQEGIYASDYNSTNILRANYGTNSERLFSQNSPYDLLILSGTAAGILVLTGYALVSKGVNGRAMGSSSLSGILSATWSTAGTVAGTSTVLGGIGSQNIISGSLAAVSTFNSNAVFSYALVGVVSMVSTMGGTVKIEVATQGVIGAATYCGALIFVSRHVTGALNDTSSLMATVTAQSPNNLSGQVDSLSTLVGGSTISHVLSGSSL